MHIHWLGRISAILYLRHFKIAQFTHFSFTSVQDVAFCPYHADLRDTRDDEFVNEVILSAHFAEEEVDFLLIRDETGADEGWIYNKKGISGDAKYAGL